MESLGSNQLTHLQRLDKTLSEHKDTNCKSINDEPFASLDCWLHDTKTKSQQSLVKKNRSKKPDCRGSNPTRKHGRLPGLFFFAATCSVYMFFIFVDHVNVMRGHDHARCGSRRSGVLGFFAAVRMRPDTQTLHDTGIFTCSLGLILYPNTHWNLWGGFSDSEGKNAID